MNAHIMAAADVPLPLPDDVMAQINLFLGWAAGLVGLVCLAKVVFVGARIAWDRQHTAGLESTPASELLAALVAWLLAAVACSGIAAALL